MLPIAADEAFARWLDDLRTFVPHGVDELAGCPVTRSGAAALLATLIYMVSVDHEIVDSGVWDYQLWSDVQPARGLPERSADAARRLPAARERQLHPERRPHSPHERLLVSRMRSEWRGRVPPFRRDLVELQETMDRAPAACWRIEPRQLKANINY